MRAHLFHRLAGFIAVILFATACATSAKQAPGQINQPTLEPQTNLKTDENVLLFPTNARFDPQDKRWDIHVHGWVFEPEQDSSWRNGTIGALKLALEVKNDTPEAKRFEERVAMFLVDNEGSKHVVVKIGQQFYTAPTTGSNGHFELIARIAKTQIDCINWLSTTINLPAQDTRSFDGIVQCVSAQGISVISDIDDTIKLSNVLDKKQLLKNTFLKDFAAVPDMATVYQSWQTQGASFHYVSSSPWQLYPALSDFMQRSGYPRGSMHLKLFRVKDSSIFNMFDSPEEGKIPTITSLLENYPQRQFILVGDSGERDPEIYATIAQRYPQQIKRIYIRNINNDEQRLQTVFKNLPKQKWLAFKDAREILPHFSQH